MPVEIVVAPTIREADGLALSSRNSYLAPAERAAAPALYRALQAAKALFDGGERDGEALRETMRRTLAAEPALRVDYVSVADAASLRELDRVEGPALASMAVRLGATRLIDNLILGV
jgi:pantoate--beta-alanine ligase